MNSEVELKTLRFLNLRNNLWSLHTIHKQNRKHAALLIRTDYGQILATKMRHMRGYLKI